MSLAGLIDTRISKMMILCNVNAKIQFKKNFKLK